jgi:hypothetical protein
MTKTVSLLSASMLVIGISAAVGHAEAADRGPQHVAANSANAANDNQATWSERAANRRQQTSGTDAVTVRPYGSHNDGYRTSQGWWKDD